MGADRLLGRRSAACTRAPLSARRNAGGTQRSRSLSPRPAYARRVAANVGELLETAQILLRKELQGQGVRRATGWPRDPQQRRDHWRPHRRQAAPNRSTHAAAVPGMVVEQLAARRAASLGGPCALRHQVDRPDALQIDCGPAISLVLVLHVVLARALVAQEHNRWMPLAAGIHLDPRALVIILHTDGARPGRMTLQGTIGTLAREGFAAARTVW
eukprot:scaffold53602_cov51-Phaeocystis_antarctica.AAC.1